MKITDKNNEKKRKIKKKPIDKSKKQQVVVVAQEIKFARLLSGNEKKTRDRVLKALKKWLTNCFEKNYEFKEDDFTRVWKGLFYAVWMSDKPLVQEDLCESIAGILDLFPNDQLPGAMLLAKAGFKMLATEWFGIDQHRIDKFLMLVRRYLRGALRCIHRCGWSEAACQQFADMLSGKDGILALKTPLYARNATSMATHIADCYLEEISKILHQIKGIQRTLAFNHKRVQKSIYIQARSSNAHIDPAHGHDISNDPLLPDVSSGEVPPDSLCVMLQPFLAYLSQGSCTPLCVASRRVLTELLRHGSQGEEAGSEDGSDEEDETAGFEENGDAGSDEEMPSALDPRAGRVDVTLCPLPVAASSLVAALRRLLPCARAAGHRRARRCIQLLEEFSSGADPFAARPVDVDSGPSIKPTKAAKALRLLEKKLVANGDELALRGLSRKHRKRLLAKSRAGLSIVDDVKKPKKKNKTNNTANGEWQVEETEKVIKDKTKRKRANKENEAEPRNKRQKINKQSEENNIKNIVKKEKNDKVKTNVKPIKNNVKEIKNIVKVKNSVKDVKHSVKDVKTNDKVKNSVKDIKNDVKVKTVVKNNTNKNVNVKTIKENGVKSKDSKLKKEKNYVTDKSNKDKSPIEAKLLVNKFKKFQKQDKNSSLDMSTPKKVKFVLKNNSMQGTMDYYRSIRESPNIPFDSSRKPTKTNLKVSTPSPINPFFKKKMTRRASFAAQIVF